MTRTENPTTGSVTITNTETPHTYGQPLTTRIEARDDDGINGRRITWTRDGAPVLDDGGRPVTGASIVPYEVGEWRAVLTVTDGFSIKPSFTSDPVTVTAPAVRSVTHDIYENHPLTKPVFDLGGYGTFAMAPVADAPDNAFFRVDSATGKIWFVPLDANDNGVKDPGDYPVLDAEDHRDAGRDGTYDLRLFRSLPDNSDRTVNLAVTVRDLPVVNAHGDKIEPHGNERETPHSVGLLYNYLRPNSNNLKERIADLIDDWFRDYRPGLTPQQTEEQKQYVKYLLEGHVWWTPPDGSTFYISYALDTRNLDSQQAIDNWRTMIENALAKYEAVLNIDFIEVAHITDQQDENSFVSNGIWRFQFRAEDDNRPSSAGIHMIGYDTAYAYRGNVTMASVAPFSTYLHEVGHVGA